METPDAGVHDIVVPGATFVKETKEIQRSAKRLLAQLADAEIEAIAADEGTVKALQQLLSVIGRKLEQGLLVGVHNEPRGED